MGLFILLGAWVAVMAILCVKRGKDSMANIDKKPWEDYQDYD